MMNHSQGEANGPFEALPDPELIQLLSPAFKALGLPTPGSLGQCSSSRDSLQEARKSLEDYSHPEGVKAVDSAIFDSLKRALDTRQSEISALQGQLCSKRLQKIARQTVRSYPDLKKWAPELITFIRATHPENIPIEPLENPAIAHIMNVFTNPAVYYSLHRLCEGWYKTPSARNQRGLARELKVFTEKHPDFKLTLNDLRKLAADALNEQTQELLRSQDLWLYVQSATPKTERPNQDLIDIFITDDIGIIPSSLAYWVKHSNTSFGMFVTKLDSPAPTQEVFEATKVLFTPNTPGPYSDLGTAYRAARVL